MFDKLSVWQFASRAEKKSGSAGNFVSAITMADLLSDDSKTRPTCAFAPAHPEADRKILELCAPEKTKVPVPIGPALPRRDVEDVLPKYCRIMLILFKPWRQPADLRNEGQSWVDAFHEFVAETGRDVRDVLDNMQIVHECKECRDDHIRNRAHHDKTRRIIADEFTQSTREVIDDTFVDDMDECAVLDYLSSMERADASGLSRSRGATDECVRIALENGLYSDPNPGSHRPSSFAEPTNSLSVAVNDRARELAWKAQYAKRRAQSKANLTSQATNPVLATQAPDLRPLVQSLDTAALREPEVQFGPNFAAPVQHVPSAADIIKKWTLNEEQALAFCLVADHAADTHDTPLRMYLGGAGGTGKSTVISALKEFFESRGETRRFRLASFTGVAARNISGSTLHAALNLQHGHLATKKGSKANEELVNMWDGVDFLFIDEVSMVGCRLLVRVSRALSMAKENNLPFGGINVIFAGDFAQLPCVREVRLYADLDFSRQAEDTIFGKLLWLSIDTVLMLRQQMRQSGKKNVRFVQLLDRLRDGECTREDYDLLQGRLLKKCKDSVQLGAWAEAPSIVTDNATKDRLNREAVLAYSRRTGRQLHWYHSQDELKKEIIESGKLKDLLDEQSSGATEQRLGKIPVVEGMRVIVAQNHDVDGGVVNGSVGTLSSLRFFKDRNDSRHLQSCVVHIPDSNFAVMEGLMPHEAPILPDKKKFVIKHAYSGETARINRTQVPLQPGYSFTAHRAQGQSYDKVVIDLEGCTSIESAYVMLSRATALDAVIILRSFQFAKITATKDFARLKEERRLRVLELQTLVRVNPHNEKGMQAQLELAQCTIPATRANLDSSLQNDGSSDAAKKIKRVLDGDNTSSNSKSRKRPHLA